LALNGFGKVHWNSGLDPEEIEVYSTVEIPGNQRFRYEFDVPVSIHVSLAEYSQTGLSRRK